MRKFILKHSLSFLALLFTVNSYAQPSFTVTHPAPSTLAMKLAEKILGNGVQIVDAYLRGDSVQATGIFFNNRTLNPKLQIDSGIVLSSGKVDDIYHKSTFLAATALNTAGDPTLNTYIATGSLDATALEIHFRTAGDTIRFNYVFGSEEYPGFTCSTFNDKFALFLAGPGIVDTINIALLPGTNTPVSINTVNNASCGVASATQYYLTNTDSLAYNAFIAKLTAIHSVTPCQVYYLKFVIADYGDRIYDSGVFIEANSLNSNGTFPIGYQSPLGSSGGNLLIEGCQPGFFSIKRTNSSLALPQSFSLTFGGNAINGVDVVTIPSTVTIPAGDTMVTVPINPIWDNLVEGTETFKIYFSLPYTCATVFDSITVRIRDVDDTTMRITPHGGIACGNAPLQITTVPSIYVQSPSYQWSPTTGVSNPTIANPLISLADSVVYTLTAVNNNCHAIDSVIFRIKKLKFLSKKDVNCQNGSTGQIHVGSAGLWNSPVQYSIGTGNYTTDSTFTNLPVGNYTIHIKDGSGCIDSMVISIVQAYPNLGFTDSTLSPCSNSLLQLTGTGGLAPYQFSVNNSTFINNNVYLLSSGTYTISVRDSNGCVSTHPVNYLANQAPAAPVVAFTDVQVCSGKTDTLKVLNPQGAYTYNWYTTATGGSPVSTGSTYIPTITTGSQTYYVGATNGSCIGPRTAVAYTINPTPAAPAVNAVTICPGGTANLQIQNPQPGITYAWYTAATGGTLLSAGSNYLASNVLTSQTIYVEAVGGSCSSTRTAAAITVTQTITPIVTDIGVCNGLNGTFQVQNPQTGYTYTWYSSAIGGTVLATGTSYTITNVTSPQTVYVEATNTGCLSTRTAANATIAAPPTVNAGGPVVMTTGGPVLLNATASSGTYLWTPSTGLSSATILTPMASPDVTTTYTLTVTSPQGCTASDTATVIVLPVCISPMNAFSPNGDGVNDTWLITGGSCLQYAQVSVYNRYGSLVYENANYRNEWDGTYKGNRLPDGTYYFIITYKLFSGAQKILKGNVTILR